MNIGILSFLSIPSAMGSPGGIYTLSGNEKSVREIIKADVEKYPDLYMGESLGAYLSEFKKVNQIGARKLAPGDELVFPETMVSLKARRAKEVEDARTAKETAIAEKAAIAEADKKKMRARHDGICKYQQELLPIWIHKTRGRVFSELQSGVPSQLMNQAIQFVDSKFAGSLSLKFYPEKGLYVIVFEQPTRAYHCYYAAIKKEGNGYSYFTLEKGISFFGTGDDSVLCTLEKDGSRVKLGGRKYNDLASFVREFE